MGCSARRKKNVCMYVCVYVCIYVCMYVCVCIYVFMSVCVSVRMEQFGSHWTDFCVIWYLMIFRKFVEKIQVWLKSVNNNGYVCTRQYVAVFFLKLDMFQTEAVGNIKTHIFNNFFSFENRAFYEIVWKNMIESDRPHDNTANAFCMQDN
jgi:hypothetical protein